MLDRQTTCAAPAASEQHRSKHPYEPPALKLEGKFTEITQQGGFGGGFSEP